MSRPVVAVPLAIERLALGRMPGVDVVRVGAGPLGERDRAAGVSCGDTRGSRVRRSRSPRGWLDGADRVVVVGVAGGLHPSLRPGDVVVADEVRDADGVVACRTDVADTLRARGLRVHVGAVHTAGHLVDGAERAELGRTGALAVDTESAPLVRAAGDRPRIVVRAIADTPDRPLRSLHTVRGGLAALRSVSRAAPALAGWALSKEVG